MYEVKCITLCDLNNRIKAADYGRCNHKTKPSLLQEPHLKSADSSLGQHSAQMLTLFRYLPLIIKDVVGNIEPMKLLLLQLFHQIIETVLLPFVTSSYSQQLQELVLQHHELLKICYPERKLLYKHHRMIHYGTILRRSGPLLRMMVMRYDMCVHVSSPFITLRFTTSEFTFFR